MPSPPGANFISLALDAKGIPYIAYAETGNNYRVSVMKLNYNNSSNNSTWQQVGERGFSSGMVRYISLAFSPQGIPYVAYQRVPQSGSDGKANVFKLEGNRWVQVGNPDFSAGGVKFTSLAFDISGIPYIAFSDIANGYKVTVMKLNPDTNKWELVGKAGFTDVASGDVSLKINNDTLYVTYRNIVNQSSTNIEKYDGTKWVSVWSEDNPNWGINYPSLAFDSYGNPYLAFSNTKNDNKANTIVFK